MLIGLYSLGGSGNGGIYAAFLSYLLISNILIYICSNIGGFIKLRAVPPVCSIMLDAGTSELVSVIGGTINPLYASPVLLNACAPF